MEGRAVIGIVRVLQESKQAMDELGRFAEWFAVTVFGVELSAAPE